ITEHGVTNAYVPPGLLTDLVSAFEERGDVGALQRLLVGVEPIAEGTLQRLRTISGALQIVNGYGPTEATICATLHRFETASGSHARTPIGRPVPGYTVRLVDAALRDVAPGETGEILIGGAGVARGYVGDDALT